MLDCVKEEFKIMGWSSGKVKEITPTSFIVQFEGESSKENKYIVK